MSERTTTELERYKHSLHKRLDSLVPVFSKAVVGDFSAEVPIANEEDELTEFFVGIQIILMAIREKVRELEASVADVRAANNVIVSEKARVEAILDGLGEGLLTIDATWRINYINEPAIALLGDNSRILGQRASYVVALEDSEGVLISEAEHPIPTAITKRMRVAIDMTQGKECYIRVGPNNRRRVAVTVTPVMQDGQVVGGAVVLRDITEESNIDHAKSEIISIASHQLRTPLTAIKWYVSAMLHKEVKISPAQTKDYLKCVYDANQHMIELVDALLNVSRIDLGTLTAMPKAVNITHVLKEVIKELAVEIKARDIAIAIKTDDLKSAFIDPGAIHIILQNLISNAIKYSDPGQAVDITVKQQAKHAEVAVRDRGCGIPAAQQAKIFTKLFRASNATTVATDGTGLGLYVTKALAEHAGGKIWFESVEGEGSTFHAIIPSKIS